MLNSFVECSALPFSGVVGSGCGCGVNVGSRFNRAGVTGTRGVRVSAVPSASVGGPACMLSGPGIKSWIVMGLSPAGQIHCRIGVSVGGMSAAAGEHAIGQCQIAANGTALGALFCLTDTTDRIISVPPRQRCL